MGRNNDCPILETNRRVGGDSCDFMKPAPIKDESIIRKQIEKF